MKGIVVTTDGVIIWQGTPHPAQSKGANRDELLDLPTMWKQP